NAASRRARNRPSERSSATGSDSDASAASSRSRNGGMRPLTARPSIRWARALDLVQVGAALDEQHERLPDLERLVFGWRRSHLQVSRAAVFEEDGRRAEHAQLHRLLVIARQRVQDGRIVEVALELLHVELRLAGGVEDRLPLLEWQLALVPRVQQ